MNYQLVKSEQLAEICNGVASADGLEVLCEKINAVMPVLNFSHVATRGNWHRLGGVVDSEYQRVNNNIAKWAEAQSGGNVDRLITDYAEMGYFVTRLAGKTHYLCAVCGDNPDEFMQIEIEELQEVLERPLLEKDWFPESIEEFLDPLECSRLMPEPMGDAHFLFRRITPVARLLKEASKESRALFNLRRFFDDWSLSSANDYGPFCQHWALALREYIDSDGECRLSAKPFSTFSEKVVSLAGTGELHGAELANVIHGYDRRVGYPFAWYFNMLGSKAENFAVAEAVLRDQMGAYDYLPAKDLKVLRSWEERPYGV